MSSLFDLVRMSKLVEAKNPVRILIVDTNVVMNNPDLKTWSIEVPGADLFVLSDTIVQELEYIKQKKGTPEKLESSKKAKLAINNIIKLLSQGDIADGIPIDSGWIIGVPSPRKDDINPELEQLEDVVSAFKRADAKLLLLTRECHQTFQSLPVTLLTGDGNFSNQVKIQGVPCHLVYSFPIEELKEANALSQPIDWKQVIDGVDTNTKEMALTVEATLIAQRLAPKWIDLVTGTKRFMIAEGSGTVCADNYVRPFIWTTLFYPQTLEKQSSDDNEGLTELPSIHLDFFGKDDFEQELFDAIADRLIDCTSINFEEGTPTLQSPQSIMEILIYMEYLYKKGASPNALERLKNEIKESEGLIHYWTDWILNTQDPDDQISCLEGFIEALNECWKIGQTYTFSIMKKQR